MVIKKAVDKSRREKFFIKKNKGDYYLYVIEEKKGLFGMTQKPIWGLDQSNAMFFMIEARLMTLSMIISFAMLLFTE